VLARKRADEVTPYLYKAYDTAKAFWDEWDKKNEEAKKNLV
jgi:hypothetical protein